LITFNKIRWQNFLSYGNQWTEIDLSTNKTTLIVGKNGSGKSTFLDAITFSLYGKPFRNINKPQLINSITDKNMLVEIEFEINKKNYLVRRGLKPTVFEVYCDKELVRQDSLMRDYQSYLENNILKINYKSFCQIVILGSGNYVPFMQLPASARRNIIEDLLDLQVFSDMNTILKERISQNKQEYESTENSLNINKSNLKLHLSHLEELKKDLQKQYDDLSKKTKNLEKEILTLSNKNEKLEVKINKKREEVKGYDKFEEKLSELKSYLQNASKQKLKIEKEIEFYTKSSSCPTCRQDIDKDFKTDIFEKCENSIKKIDSNIELAHTKIDQLSDKLKKKSELVKVLGDITEEYISNNQEINIKRAMIDTFLDQGSKLINKVGEIPSDKKEDFETKIKELTSIKEELVKKKEILSIAGQLLKDGGLKTVIIKQYIPVMNKVINQYLSQMNFYIDFNLDENFNEVIKSRNKDEFSYESFSEGEKARINLAILFAWRSISKMRNTASTNILIFDEIFDGSLDIEGSDDFMKILNTIAADNSVFIISHKIDSASDKFSNIIKFDKAKQFSRMEKL